MHTLRMGIRTTLMRCHYCKKHLKKVHGWGIVNDGKKVHFFCNFDHLADYLEMFKQRSKEIAEAHRNPALTGLNPDLRLDPKSYDSSPGTISPRQRKPL